jgi:hypothetical protein
MEQNVSKRGTIYLKPSNGEPYTEDEARYIDYWIAMGFNPFVPEFASVPSSDLTPELTRYEITVWLN